MKLANRTYLYRMLHVAFGAKPTAESVRMLASDDTVQALERLSASAEVGRVHIEEAAPEGVRTSAAAEALADAAGVLAGLKGSEGEARVEELDSAFTALFLVPGNSYVYPWESPYVGQETMLFQESTLDVKAHYRRFGYAARTDEGHFPEDHIAMMFDFLAHMAERTFDAFGEGDDEWAKQALAAQKEFVDGHLRTWASLFSEEVRKNDSTGVYSALARIAALFVEADGLFLDGAVAEYEAVSA